MTLKNLDRIFTHNELYFSRPDQFNDPFDCKTHFTFKDCNENDIRKYFRHAFKEHEEDYAYLSDSEKDCIIEDRVKEFRSGKSEFPKKMINTIKEYLPKSLDTLRILCLSEVYDEIRMWSHYSDGHQGIVLQFDKGCIKKQFTACKNVDYYPEFPTLRDYSERFQEQMFLLTKLVLWQYEKEWRIIEIVKNGEKDEIGKVYRFDKAMLTGIILGCEISKEDEDRIFMWRDYGQPQAKIYRAFKDEDSYAIKIDFSILE